MSSLTQLSDAELDAVNGGNGFGFHFEVNKNVAVVNQGAANYSLVNIAALQNNSQSVSISQHN